MNLCEVCGQPEDSNPGSKHARCGPCSRVLRCGSRLEFRDPEGGNHSIDWQHFIEESANWLEDRGARMWSFGSLDAKDMDGCAGLVMRDHWETCVGISDVGLYLRWIPQGSEIQRHIRESVAAEMQSRGFRLWAGDDYRIHKYTHLVSDSPSPSPRSLVEAREAARRDVTPCAVPLDCSGVLFLVSEQA